jgi:4-carboxymuconolactone decarboxylase
MARVNPVSHDQARWFVRLTYWFTRRAITALTGRCTEAMIEPVQVYARIPALLRGYAKLEQATANLTALPDRVKALAELRAATLTACEYCVDLGSEVARRWGMTDAQLLALPVYRSSDLFTDADKVVLDYATGMSRTPVDVSDELFAALREHFDDTQLVELTHVIALENLRGRFNHALGIGAAGFSAGAVCAVPASPTTRQDQP